MKPLPARTSGRRNSTPLLEKETTNDGSVHGFRRLWRCSASCTSISSSASTSTKMHVGTLLGPVSGLFI